MNKNSEPISFLYEDLELSDSSSCDNVDVCEAPNFNRVRYKRRLSSSTIGEKVKYMSSSDDETSSCSWEEENATIHKVGKEQEQEEEEEEEEENYDPDKDITPGCSGWGVLMSKNVNKRTWAMLGTKTVAKAPMACDVAGVVDSISSEIKSGTYKRDEYDIPECVLSMFTYLLEQEKFQFTQPLAVLGLARKQINEAMKFAFSAMISSSGVGGAAKIAADTHEDKGTGLTMSLIVKTLSNIAVSSNPDNSFRPAASVFGALSSKQDRSKRRKLDMVSSTTGLNSADGISRVCSKVMFFREIHAVISLYLSLVYVQRAMNNNNTNSSGYSEGMVVKMLNILDKIPHGEMSREKYISVGRDALYLYQNIITDVTGPKHSKRLRTPQQQAYFCYVIAMLVNDVPIASDLTLTGKATNLVQFASAMIDPAYHLAVHKLACVTNSSYSVYKALGLSRESLVRADEILAILSARSNSLSERKPRTLAQSVFLYLHPELRDKLRASGLTNEESSLGTAIKLVSQQLKIEGVTRHSLEDGCSIIGGTYNSEGKTLKCFGFGYKDIKIMGLAILFLDRTRKLMKTNLPYY
uniref:Wsv282-like protein n=1 Tax=Metapenaeus ensis nimavirus TaxID=2133794 RepID=A0A401IPD6_9VIRU|nr:MAG: wsv282-like protein [Metapenaeus ensis nimavirus]GBG35461.1 wsv282-like protein [Metapenaeus ensis nimavirus]